MRWLGGNWTYRFYPMELIGDITSFAIERLCTHLVDQLKTGLRSHSLVRGDVQDGCDDKQYCVRKPQWATKKAKRPPVEHNRGQI